MNDKNREEKEPEEKRTSMYKIQMKKKLFIIECLFDITVTTIFVFILEGLE